MTLSEAKGILITRIGWRDDKTIDGFTLSAPNLQTDSSRVFQSAHSAITLENIRDCQPITNISESDFNEYLEFLREQTINHVLSDVFEKDYVDDNLFNLYPTSFDDLVVFRMTIEVSELIMTATRNNRIKRLTNDFIGKLNYDVFREAPNKFAVRQVNYTHTMGIATKYAFKLKSVQRRFGQNRNLLRTITRGQVFQYNEDELRSINPHWN